MNAAQSLKTIAERNESVGAFLQVFDDAEAKADGALAGVPIGIKDNICTDRGRTTCGSKLLGQYESPYSATVIERLEAAGAVIVGKTAMDEFAMGSSCETCAFGTARNPWDTSRVPGGSSGGSAAAVAAGMVPVALGSDTGGSIRQPAALCGVVGFKPTYGRVSRWGLVAYASSLDQIGPIARDVETAAKVYAAIAGEDPKDATSSSKPVGDPLARLEEAPEKPVFGVPAEARAHGNDPSVIEALDRAVAKIEAGGGEVREVELPRMEHGIAAYYLVATAEASSNLARFDGLRYGRRAELEPGEGLLDLYCKSRTEGFGEEVRRRIMLGTYALSSGYYDAYYNTALKARRLIKNDYDAVFGSGVDAVLMPATTGPAFEIGSKRDDPLAMYLEDVYTVGANLAGLPGVTLPAGLDETGEKPLPVGLQLIGPAFGDNELLRAARWLEGLIAFEAEPAF